MFPPQPGERTKRMANQRLIHEPVLVREVMETLDPRPGQFIVDATLGHAGHTIEFLRRLGKEGLLIGLDRDPQMLEAARQRIDAAQLSSSRTILVEADHADLLSVLDRVPVPSPVHSAPDAVLI